MISRVPVSEFWFLISGFAFLWYILYGPIDVHRHVKKYIKIFTHFRAGFVKEGNIEQTKNPSRATNLWEKIQRKTKNNISPTEFVIPLALRISSTGEDHI
jgi:hypothetical protein